MLLHQRSNTNRPAHQGNGMQAIVAKPVQAYSQPLAGTSRMLCQSPGLGVAQHCPSRYSTSLHTPSAAAPGAVTETRDSSSSSTNLQQLRGKLQLFNTMSRRKELFKTRHDQPNKVQMYVCGVTVYDYSHIGHARVYVAFDVLYRLLAQALKYDVQYVRNFTDIDDKIIARANERGEDPMALSSRFIDEFHQDMRALNCLNPSMEPRATQYIAEMIASIEAIIKNGHAYAVEGGDVYFEVDSLPGYGQLSGRATEDNRAGERVAVDSRKRGPADFALWKAAKPGEPSWPSPWGPGRPGWHIECSAMIQHVMGNVIDIHGGGRDLVFPHHENELAQARAMQGPSCCNMPHHHNQSHDHQQGGSSGTTADSSTDLAGVASTSSSNGSAPEPQFVRYWLHNGFVNVDSEKMSKSLGNFFTIRDVLQKFHPLALRWFLVTTHYRAPVNYSSRALEEASDRLYYVYQALLDAQAALTAAGAAGAAEQAAAAAMATSGSTQLQTSMLGHLLDDLNTPAALSELSAPLKAINDLLTTKAGRKQPDRLKQLALHQQSIWASLSLLGLLPAAREGVATVSQADAVCDTDVLETALAEMRALALARAGITEVEVQAQIQARAAARVAKDFAAADAIRLALAQKGIGIMDTPQGTTWRPVLNA